jgi:hypothetical protein
LEVRYRVKALLRKVKQGFTSSKIRYRLIAAELWKCKIVLATVTTILEPDSFHLGHNK